MIFSHPRDCAPGRCKNHNVACGRAVLRHYMTVQLRGLSVTNAVKAVLYDWDEVRLDRVRGSITRRFISTDHMTVGQIVLEKGDDVPRHSHENEQLTYVITGSLKFWFGASDEQELVVSAGSMVVIPAGLPHRALALESTFEIDIFNPPRSDWQDGSDTYFRR